MKMADSSLESNDYEEKCIFCNIAKGNIKAKKIYSDDKITAFLDINPANPGHVLIIPNKHVLMFPLLDDSLVGYIFAMAKNISLIMLKVLDSKGSTILVGNGAIAGQKAPHALLHLIPRYPDDDIGLVPPIKQIDDKKIKELRSALTEAMKKFLDEKNIIEKKEEQNEEETDDEFDADRVSKLFLGK